MLIIDSEDFSAAEWVKVFEHIAKAFENYKRAPTTNRTVAQTKWFASNFKVAVQQIELGRR